MIYILTFIIVLLSIAIIYISIDFRKTKNRHENKVAELNFVIAGLIASNENQLGQLKLSDELRQKLNLARETIDKDILNMQHDFVATLSKNQLLD